jgi:hypothetical protein
VFIQGLEKLGALEYYSQFPRPFFNLDIPQTCILKGIQGNSYIRMYVLKSRIDRAIHQLMHHLGDNHSSV